MHPEMLTVGGVARLSGLSRDDLRHYHARGWLVPSVVDPGTGYRGYSQHDLDRARLLAALRSTGMPVNRAARVVATDDRDAVLGHLESLERAAATLWDLLPLERPGWTRQLTLPPEELVLVDIEAGDVAEPEAALGAVQARAAVHRDAGVAQLPRAPRPEGLPGGSALGVWWRDGAAEGDASVELPWDGAPPPPGARHGTWPGGEVLVCAVRDEVTVEQAHGLLDHAVDRGGFLEWSRRRQLYTPELVCGAVLACVTR